MTASHPLPDTGRPDHPDLDAIEARANEATAAPWMLEEPKPISQSQGFPDGMIVAAVAPGQRIFAKAERGTFPEADRKFIASARQDIPVLVAYARRLEAEVAALRGVVKDGFAEGFNAGVGIGEDWTRPNAKRAREEAWENSDAREAATPGEEGWKE